MNRIILIGNGFDLAHGLKTSYRDFIDDFWRQEIKSIRQKSETTFAHPCLHIKNYEDNVLKINDSKYQYVKLDTSQLFGNYKEMKECVKSSFLTIKNRFLEVISDKEYLQNWVDIEDEYFKQLKSISQNKSLNYSDEDNTSIAELNKEFEQIKKSLNDYLIEISGNEITLKDVITEKIYSQIKLRDLTNKGVELFIEEKIFEHYQSKRILEEKQFAWHQYPAEICNFQDWENTYDATTLHHGKRPLFQKEKELRDKIKDVLDETYHTKNIFLTYPKKTLFLNFNYTNTEQQYIEVNRPNLFSISGNNFSENYGIAKESIHIHGELNNRENPIIFGYGDELGDDYAVIEKMNNNNYLENVKSMKYSETDNYKRLSEFINSGGYQIFIFGHSCGISDRTLLNTLFEHDNCVSIKPFYHKKSDGTDNYSELTKNISRNFTDKKMMREKVVNKIYCEPFL